MDAILDLRIGEKFITLSNLSIYYRWKNIKAYKTTINLKYLHQHGMINSNYLINLIFKTILNMF